MDNSKLTPEIPFNPSFVNIPVYLAIHGKDKSKDNYGVSQIDILLEALVVFEEKAQTFTDSDDKEMTLITIRELRETILDVLYSRLSESSAILHAIKTINNT